MFNKLFHNIIFLSLVSFIIVVLQQGEINRDGVMYLTQAQYFLEGNASAGNQIYNWPFFSKLIVKVHLLSDLSLQNAAHLINTSLFLIAAFFYLKNLTLITAHRVPLIFGLLTLLTAITLMDDYLAMVLRDHGQWAGFMAGVYFYLRWSQQPNWLNAILWQLSFLLGTLFRPELLIFNIFLPFISPFIFRTQNMKLQFIQSICLPIIGFCGGLIFLLFNQNSLITLDLARLTEIVSRPQAFLNNLTQPLNIKVENYHLRVLIEDYANSFKYLFFSYVLLYKWIAGLGLLHVALFIYALKRELVQSPWLKPLSIFFVLSAIITSINLYATNILANRYWVMNWWVVYLFVAIGMSHLWHTLQKKSSPRYVWGRRVLVILIGIHFANILIDKPVIHFEQNAGQWIKEQQIDLNNVYFNEKRTAFYAGQLAFKVESLNRAVNIIQYQYLAIRYKRFDEIKPIKNYQPIQYFPSQEKPKLIIYQKVNHD